MFKFVKATEFCEDEFVRSKLTGTIISKSSEAYRHEREIEHLCSIPSQSLSVILDGSGGASCHSRCLTAVRGPAEVAFIRNDIVRLRAIFAQLQP